MKAGRSTLVTESIPGFDLSEVICESGSRVIYRALRESDGEEVVLSGYLADDLQRSPRVVLVVPPSRRMEEDAR